MKTRLLLLLTALQFCSLIYAQLSTCMAPLKVGNSWKYYEPPDGHTGYYYRYEIADSAYLPNGNYYYGKEYAYYRLREDGYYAQYNEEMADSEWVYYKKDAQLGNTWQQDNKWGRTYYTAISDTFSVYVLGKIVKVKQVDITDSLIAGGTEFWTEEFGLIDLRHEFFFFHIIGAVINDTAYGDTTSISIKEEGLRPAKYDLSQNYPNPFNPSTTIEYEIKEAEHITLKIYDMLGAEIETLINEWKPIGKYKIKFTADNLAAGVYLYRLTSQNYTHTRKMILLK